MKIVSWNVNGIRAVERKGELDKVISKNDPDILLVQETKARAEQLTKIDEAYPQYDKYYNAAEKKGYSGVGVWIRKEIDHSVEPDFPTYDDNEGRILRLDIGDVTIFNGYFPNGGKSEEAWEEKLVFYDAFHKHINDLRSKGRKVMFFGDVNVAHNEIDLARPKDNDGKVGFHPKERAWVNRIIEDNWVDVWRLRNPNEAMYSWWHLLSGARKRNVGWRIDYLFIDRNSMDLIASVDYDNDQMGSDHCPMVAVLKK